MPRGLPIWRTSTKPSSRWRRTAVDLPPMAPSQTPAGTAAGTRYAHLACTAYLTHMHTGDRSAEAIDVGCVLPGYSGVVRDGYYGDGHLTDALHAWCEAHLLRDLKDLHDLEPEKQDWAVQMAALFIEAPDAAQAARQAGSPLRCCRPGRPGHPLPCTGRRSVGRKR